MYKLHFTVRSGRKQHADQYTLSACNDGAVTKSSVSKLIAVSLLGTDSNSEQIFNGPLDRCKATLLFRN